ncbi:TPA: aspartate phosphatase, partial [Bacillus thuringiensis]|nr:aspartate phosphatase [Bacillus thuringiensis]
KEHYEIAENSLKNIPDEIEKAEFYYNQAVFQYHYYQAFVAFQQATKAKEIFTEHNG